MLRRCRVRPPLALRGSAVLQRRGYNGGDGGRGTTNAARMDYYDTTTFTKNHTQRIVTRKKGKVLSWTDQAWDYWKPSNTMPNDLADSFQIFKGVMFVCGPLLVLQYYRGYYEAYPDDWQEEAMAIRNGSQKQVDFSDTPNSQSYDDMRQHFEVMQESAIRKNEAVRV